jgi:hypothetical protein
MEEGARVHHSYGSCAPSTYGSYEPRRANPSTASVVARSAFSRSLLRDCASGRIASQGGAAGYASGGFLSDSVVEGLIASGSQQQVNARECRRCL